MSESVIETRQLSMYYGKQRGIIDVYLSVWQGEVFGFLGPNGAGKTTTQRILLDVIRPTSGSAHIFGMNCQTQGAEIRRQVGYLPGELSLYPNMKAIDFLDMLNSFYGNSVDKQYRDQLFQRLELDPRRRMKQYSHGNKQKVGIVAAFMHQPDLLVLDEPTTGLDPLVQQTVLELVREARFAGRTVFLSSHNLPEVQAVCDRVGIIRGGRMIKTESVEALTHQQFKRFNLTFRDPVPPEIFALEGVVETGREDQTVMLEVRQNLDLVMQKAAVLGVLDIEILPVTLEEIFLAYYGRQNQRGNHV